MRYKLIKTWRAVHDPNMRVGTDNARIDVFGGPKHTLEESALGVLVTGTEETALIPWGNIDVALVEPEAKPLRKVKA